jgi:uncharacterized protein with LGFP repeats
MQEWIRTHQKKLSLGAGMVLLLLGTALLFWDNRGSAVSEEERIAAANVARMEARMQSRHGGTAAPDKAIFGTSYRDQQAQQLRYAVMALMFFGVVFMLYGFLKKEE